AEAGEVAGRVAGADHRDLLDARAGAAVALGRARLADVDLALRHEVALDRAAAAAAVALAAAGGAGAFALAEAGALAGPGADAAALARRRQARVVAEVGQILVDDVVDDAPVLVLEERYLRRRRLLVFLGVRIAGARLLALAAGLALLALGRALDVDLLA